MLALGATAVAMAVTTAGAAAADCGGDGPTVHVQVVDGAEATFTPADVVAGAPLDSDPYLIRSDARTGGTEVEFASPWPVRDVVATVLQEAADSVTFLTVEIGDQRATLDDVGLREAGSNGFENDQLPAIFINSCNDLGYVRPLRSGDASDTNPYLQTSTGNRTLEVTVHTSGRVLTPTITGPAEVAVGKAAAFRVAVDGGGADLTYDWTFGDGGHSAERSPTHVFAAAGDYRVSLSVTGSDSSSGRSNTLRVDVPAAAVLDPPDPGTDDTLHSDHAIGETHANDGAADSEGKVHQAKPTSVPQPEDVGHGGSTDGAGADPDGTATGPSTSAAPTPGSPGAGRVEGRLLAGGQVVLAPEQGAEPTAPSLLPGTDDEPLRLPWWVGLSGVLVSTVGLGALSESPWVRRVRRARRTTSGMMRP